MICQVCFSRSPWSHRGVPAFEVKWVVLEPPDPSPNLFNSSAAQEHQGCTTGFLGGKWSQSWLGIKVGSTPGPEWWISTAGAQSIILNLGGDDPNICGRKEEAEQASVHRGQSTASFPGRVAASAVRCCHSSAALTRLRKSFLIPPWGGKC